MAKRTQNEALEHGLVNDAAGCFLIRSQRLEFGELDGRGNQVRVNLVEVDDRAVGSGLLPERHEHEAEGRFHASSPS